MTEVYALNRLYIDKVRTLPIDFIVKEFGLSATIVRAIRKIPESHIHKLTDVNQFLMIGNEELQCQLSKLSRQP